MNCSSRQDLRPSIQFYPADWIAEMRGFSLEARGLWIEMLIIMFQSPERGYLKMANSQKHNSKSIAKILGLPEEVIIKTLQELAEGGIFSITDDGTIYCRRMARDWNLHKTRVKVGLLGANKRWQSDSKSIANCEEEEEEEGSSIVFNNNKQEVLFNEIWSKYPVKDGKKLSWCHFKASVNSEKSWQDINKALENYLTCKKVKNGYIKNGSTWFNNWRDWIDYKEEGVKKDERLYPCSICQKEFIKKDIVVFSEGRNVCKTCRNEGKG